MDAKSKTLNSLKCIKLTLPALVQGINPSLDILKTVLSKFSVILLNCIRLVLHRVLPGLINVWLQLDSPIYFRTVRLNPYLLFKGSKREMRVNLDSAGSWLLAAKKYNNLLLFRLHLDIIYFHFL